MRFCTCHATGGAPAARQSRCSGRAAARQPCSWGTPRHWPLLRPSSPWPAGRHSAAAPLAHEGALLAWHDLRPAQHAQRVQRSTPRSRCLLHAPQALRSQTAAPAGSQARLAVLRQLGPPAAMHAAAQAQAAAAAGARASATAERAPASGPTAAAGAIGSEGLPQRPRAGRPASAGAVLARYRQQMRPAAEAWAARRGVQP